MKPKILLAEPDQMLAEAISYALKQAGFEVGVALDSERVLEMVRLASPHLCILSAELSVQDGGELCCNLRRDEDIALKSPILMLGTDPEEETCVSMLECGVDDYLVKPFGMHEFMARVHVLLRRDNMPQESLADEEVCAGRFTLNVRQQTLTIEEETEKKVIFVTPKECQLLRLLMASPGSLIPRTMLTEHVWGRIETKSTMVSTLTVHVCGLRQKIEKDPTRPEHIMLVRGVGYRFMP